MSAVGCGDGRPQRVPVAGQVLIDGKPLALATVWVIPADARAAFGATDAEGRFRLTTYEADDGCVLGEHPVAVTALRNVSETQLESLAPPHYQDVATSGLTISIAGPRDDVKLELSWNGQQPERRTVRSDGDSLGQLPPPPAASP